MMNEAFERGDHCQVVQLLEGNLVCRDKLPIKHNRNCPGCLHLSPLMYAIKLAPSTNCVEGFWKRFVEETEDPEKFGDLLEAIVESKREDLVKELFKYIPGTWILPEEQGSAIIGEVLGAPFHSNNKIALVRKLEAYLNHYSDDWENYQATCSLGELRHVCSLLLVLNPCNRFNISSQHKRCIMWNLVRQQSMKEEIIMAFFEFMRLTKEEMRGVNSSNGRVSFWHAFAAGFTNKNHLLYQHLLEIVPKEELSYDHQGKIPIETLISHYDPYLTWENLLIFYRLGSPWTDMIPEKFETQQEELKLLVTLCCPLHCSRICTRMVFKKWIPIELVRKIAQNLIFGES